MRSHVSLFLVAGLLFIGCGKDQSSSSSASTNAASSANPLTAPVDYLGAAAKARQSAEKTLSPLGLEQAIQMFHAQEGRFPKNLQELVPVYLASIPPAPAGARYDYDSKTGFLKVVRP